MIGMYTSTSPRLHVNMSVHPIHPPAVPPQGRTAPIPLSSKRNDFERNNRDVFSVQGVDLGELQAVVVRKDNAGASSDWHLASVEVYHPGALRRSLQLIVSYFC